MLIFAVIVIGLFALLQYVKKYFQGGQFRKDDIRIDGKVVIITGCNTGIGKVTAEDLARRGAKVYMACRDQLKCEEARQEIIQKTGNQNVLNRKLDLSSLESVRSFAEQFLREETRLDILINNAGVMICPKSLTKDGLECQIGVNHLGHFLLTNLLLDVLKKSEPSRIVVVSSVVHKYGQINKEDFNSENTYDRYKAYYQSKLANVLFTRYLAVTLEHTGVTVNSLHPGVVNTELLRHVNPFIMWILSPLINIGFKTPESGAQTTLRLALDPELAHVSGKYFSDCVVAPEGKAARNEETARWLWKKSVELTHLKVD